MDIFFSILLPFAVLLAPLWVRRSRLWGGFFVFLALFGLSLFSWRCYQFVDSAPITILGKRFASTQKLLAFLTAFYAGFAWLIFAINLLVTPKGKKFLKLLLSLSLSLIVFLYELIERRHGKMLKQESAKDTKDAAILPIAKETNTNQPLAKAKVDLGNINYGDAREAAGGWWRSKVYQKRRQREVETVKAATEADKALTEAIVTKTRLVNAVTELSTATGQTDQLPERERSKAEIEQMELENQKLKLQVERAELEKQLREVEERRPVELKAEERQRRGVEAELDNMERGVHDLVAAAQAQERILSSIDRNKNPQLYQLAKNKTDDILRRIMEK